MSTTPESTKPRAIPRCQHIKANGVQCGSPALRTQRHCFFHHQHRRRTYQFDPYEPAKSALNLPALEDANSVQVVLTEVLRLILTRHIDHKSGCLLLRALRLAAANVKYTTFDPKQKTHIVIDPESVENRPQGATAWSETEGQAFDYDNDNSAQIVPESEAVPAPRPAKSADANQSRQRDSDRPAFTRDEHEMPENNMDERSRACIDDLMRLTVGQVIDPNYLNRRPADKPPVDTSIEVLTP
jgi:hypothetical protein